MKDFSKTLLIASAVNIILLVIGFFQPLVFILFIVCLVLEILFGIIFSISKSSRRTGQALLLIGVVSLIIGFTVCSAMLRIGNVH